METFSAIAQAEKCIDTGRKPVLLPESSLKSYGWVARPKRAKEEGEGDYSGRKGIFR